MGYKMFYGCFACMCDCTTCMQYLCRTRRGFTYPGTGVRGGCNLPCGFWKLNLGPLEEQTMLLDPQNNSAIP